MDPTNATEMVSHIPDEDCSAFIDHAVSEKERVRMTRDGKDVAAAIPIEDLELLEQFEDHLDLLEALEPLDEAVEKGGVIPWERFEAELGISWTRES